MRATIGRHLSGFAIEQHLPQDDGVVVCLVTCGIDEGEGAGPGSNRTPGAAIRARVPSPCTLSRGEREET